MQLRLDAADRLVALVEERRGPIYAEEAARRLFALRHVPAGLARSLLDDVVGGDARLAWSGDSVRLETPLGHDLPVESATYVVVDLETTGLPPGPSGVLGGRAARASLASLAYFFGTAARPCHRALPDAQATAEVLLALIGLAQERGAMTVADLCELASTRTRRVYEKRSLAFGAPPSPGVYLFRDRF